MDKPERMRDEVRILENQSNKVEWKKNCRGTAQRVKVKK
jgi:hypothetical protein